MAVPNVFTDFNDWFEPLTFGVVREENVNGYLKENITNIDTRGIIQPFGASAAKILPEGARYWEYRQVHCLPDVRLEIGSYILYKDLRYKVMARLDYSDYGYLEYHITEAFEDDNE